MAAEEKKPKIDLKARLGKAQGGAGPAPGAAPVPLPGGLAGGPVTPPPVMGQRGSLAPPPGAGGSVPPVAASPGASGLGMQVGVPMPPFAGAAAAKPTTDPFGAQIAPTRSMAPQQTLKIELDEETMRAAQKGGKRGAILATITALGGLGLGFAWGGRSADAKGATIALEGAQELIVDIDKSQAKIKELSEKIGAAVKDMKEKKFPETFSSDLGGLSIPFGAEKLAGRNIGRFDGKTLQLLISYTNSVEALNDRKDALKNLFSGQKKAIVDALGAAGNPKVSWSVFVQKSAHGPLGFLAPVSPADAFAYKEQNWPAKFKISNGKEFVDTERYATGDVISGEKKVISIPIDPDSIAVGFPNDTLGRITSELAKTAGTLSGGGGGPDDDETGIIKKGDLLLTALKKIGQK